MLREGETLGPYRLQKKLGGGAYGMVFLAEPVQGMVRVPVALKVPYEQSNPLELAVEARVWLRAGGHPNIVPVLGADVHDGYFVIASEYVEGGSLRDRIGFRSGKGLPPAEVARLASGILAGLEHLHARGVIHRDLKPDNVLLQSGVPRLTDFGVAKVLTRTRGHGQPSGTVMYMPPEAFSGQVSAAADVWSAGVIFYELLTGRLPFDGENEFAIMDAIRGAAPPPLPPSVPPRLRAVIERALSKDPEARFKSAAEMRQALGEGPDPPAVSADPARHNAGRPRGDRLAGESKHSPSPAGGGGRGGGVVAPGLRTEPMQPAKEKQPEKKSRRPWLPLIGAGSAVLLAAGLDAKPIPITQVKKKDPPRRPAPRPARPRPQRRPKPAATAPPYGRRSPEPEPPALTVRVNPKDGAEMVWIPAGDFLMGTDPAEIDSTWTRLGWTFPKDFTKDEAPAHRERVSGFWLYRHEVTVAQYRRFCWEKRRPMPPAPSWGWNDTHPVVNVSWIEAQAYCAWAGVRLPTQAEWERAARGPNTGLGGAPRYTFPWGDDLPKGSAGVGNLADETLKPSYSYFTGYVDGYKNTAPVGSFAESAWKLHDMAGNVWEWCADWYAEKYYRNSPPVDPPGPGRTGNKVLRGGSWDGSPNELRAAVRNDNDPGIRDGYLGFRPARTR